MAARRFSDARLIVVFGSVVAGAARPWSDLDIGVSGVSFWRGAAIGHALGVVAGREPHVVDLDTASDHLRFEVARGGSCLIASPPDVWPEFQAQAALRWFDLAPIVALCRQGVEARMQREAGLGG